MRHEYAGDVDDFGKYALLTALAREDLVRYLNVCAKSNNDGLFPAGKLADALRCLPQWHRTEGWNEEKRGAKV